jgi:hypothetical protein
MIRITRLAGLLAALAACDGTIGTVRLDLTTAPGSTVLAPVTRLKLTLTSPHEELEAGRNANGGFDLSLSFDANGEVGALILEGLDASGALVATGASPPFSIGPTNAHVVIYVAAPLSIAAAPVTLAPARSGVSAVGLPYGVLFAGGRDAAGVPSDAIAIYNAYDHTIASGQTMPVKRTDMELAVTSSGGVYLIGGVGADGNPVPSVLRFETTVQPAGGYNTFGDQPAFARANETAVAIAGDRFLLTGTPPGELAAGMLAARTELATLPSVGAAVNATDGIRTAVFIGDAGLVRFRNDRFDMLAGPGRQRAGIAATPATGKLVIAGGGDATAPVRDLLVVDPATGMVDLHRDLLATARFAPAVAATDRYVVVAGGVDASAAPIATAEVFELGTLALVATLPIAARAGAVAFTLPNGQVLIGGGSPATDLIELFTPPPP